MTRKVLSLAIALMMALTAVALADVPAFEDIEFPDGLPGGLYLCDEDTFDYSYDDLTEAYNVEILFSNYGNARSAKEDDPQAQWLMSKFNIDLTLTQVLSSDLETLISTRFAAGDEADVTMMPSQSVGFNLNSSGLLIDAKTIYPYMPLNCKYVTKNMIDYSTNSNGELAFITSYGIQDGVWGLVIRQDWLDALGMSMPSTYDELIEYAKRVTFEDPDGNGVADTYFMTGAGSGNGFGMLAGFEGMFGPEKAYVAEDGTLSHPYYNGVRKGYLSFLHELYEANVFAPDWYTIEWETAKAYTLNDKIGLVQYPAANIYGEYMGAQGVRDMAVADNWAVMETYPVEGGKFVSAGNPGFLWGFSSRKIDSDGKLMRIAHMIDTMRAGGVNREQCVQLGNDSIYEAMGIECVTHCTTYYQANTDGTYMYYQIYEPLDENHQRQYPYNSDNDRFFGLDPLQQFGLNTSWGISNPEPEDDYEKEYNALVNKGSIAIAGYDRWPNYGLAVVLTDEAAEAQAMLKDFVNNAELEFVTGVRSLDDYDAFVAEWEAQGGDAILQQTAECLGATLP